MMGLRYFIMETPERVQTSRHTETECTLRVLEAKLLYELKENYASLYYSYKIVQEFSFLYFVPVYISTIC